MVEAAAAPRLDPSRRRHRGSSSAVALSPSSGSNANADANAGATARRASNPRPNLKTVASRYLLTPFSSSSKPTSTSSSSSTASTATNSRRSASPAPRRPAGAAGRSRPVVVPNNAATADAATRTFSVAFQSPAYSLDTGKARPVFSLSLAAAAPVTPEKRRSSKNAGAAATRGRVSDDVRCPAAANAAPYGFGGGTVARSVEHCSPDKKAAAASLLAAVWRPTGPFYETLPRRTSVDGAEYQRQALSSDTESASSTGSHDNAGAAAATASGARPSPRSIMSSSARFAVGSRSDRFVGQITPFPPRTSGVASPSPRTAPAKKKSLLNTFLSSPFSRSSPIIKQPASSPRTVTGVAVAGRLQGKGSSTHCRCNPDSDMRRKAPGDHKAEEEHLLRTLHSRHLQWRRANARADAALSAQALAAEKHLCGAWAAILGMRRSVALRKIQLQLLRNDCKLMAILRGQMIYLEEWSLLDKEHNNSLSGTVGALNGTVLRLPVSDGAAADIQGVKNAVASAVNAMQTIGNSTSNLMSKLARANASVSQLCGVTIQEHALMAQCRELLSMLASVHVKYSSLQGQRVQLQMTKRRLRCS